MRPLVERVDGEVLLVLELVEFALVVAAEVALSKEFLEGLEVDVDAVSAPLTNMRA